MKRIIKSLLTLSLILSTVLVCFKVKAFEPVEPVFVGESSYYQGETVETNYLEGRLEHNKYIGYSSSGLEGFNAAGSGGGGLNIPDYNYPQSVNVLSIPSNTPTKVVNWTYQSNYGWALATVEQIAKNFEDHNPGWKVVAAINADFFDINSTKPLPLTTSGVFESNNRVYKTASSSSTAIGFTNNGTNNTLIGNKLIEVTEYYTIRVFDENDQIIKDYQIDNVNPDNAAGISLYYSYPVFELDKNGQKTGNRITVSSTLPEGGLICEHPTNCIPMDNTGFYGNGKLELSANEIVLNKERFGIYTDNSEVKDILLSGAYVTIQKDIIGAYAEADNIVGCGVPLVLEGKGIVYNNKERHPRTMVGVKEDGTLLMVTVDGRQPDDQMYGMTSDEQAALMEYYGAKEAYNLDGGGSTTMLIREGNEFRVLNSPSDAGGARRDSNAILIVIPDASLKLDAVKDTTVSLELPDLPYGINVKDYFIKINGETYTITDKLVVENLLSKTEYTIEYEYKITYDGNERLVTGTPIEIKTGNIIPKLSKFMYRYEDNKLIIDYELTDPDETIVFATLFVGNKDYDIDLEEKQIIVANAPVVDSSEINIVMVYMLQSSTDGTLTEKIYNPEKSESDSNSSVEPSEPNVPSNPDEPVKDNGCKSASYFILTTIMLSLCGAIIIKRK